jgi:transcriptional regulator of NAD metabolism
MQHVYALVSARIKHIKKRFKVYEFFEKMRMSVFENHNALVDGATQEVSEAVEKAKRLIGEFNVQFERLNEVIGEV